MKKKVAHMTSVHSPFDIRIFRKECKTLVNAGYEVTLIVPYHKEEWVEGVQIRPVQKYEGRFHRMFRTVGQIYRTALQVEADIYHFHDPELIPVGLLLKLKGKKVVYDVHEDVPRQILSKYWIPKPFRKVISVMFELFENLVSKKFDAVVTATPHINERFLRLGCHSVNVNNYPILNEFHFSGLDWSSKEHCVCYVGGISEARGIIQMVNAIGKTNAVLLLAGQFSPSKMREQIVKLPGWNQIQELGQLNREGVKRTLSKAKAGLVVLHPIANYVESLPIKMFEYMAAGIPVIASHFPLWKEIVEGNLCGICVDPMNSDAIANAIQWIVDHPDEAKRMGENGRKAVETKYNWEQEANKLVALYQILIRQN